MIEFHTHPQSQLFAMIAQTADALAAMHNFLHRWNNMPLSSVDF